MVCICSEALSPLLCPSLPAQWFPGVPLQHLHAISSPAALAAPACWRWGCWEPGQLGESSKKWVLADLSFLKFILHLFPLNLAADEDGHLHRLRAPSRQTVEAARIVLPRAGAAGAQRLPRHRTLGLTTHVSWPHPMHFPFPNPLKHLTFLSYAFSDSYRGSTSPERRSAISCPVPG